MRRVLIVLGVLCLTGCSDRTGPPVEFVVPKGFTGVIWLLLEPAGQDIPLVDGRYRIVVPADGVFRVRSSQPLEQWHVPSASYADGTPIPWDNGSGASLRPEAVAVRNGGAGVTHRGGQTYRYHIYYVGTAKQRDAMASSEPDIPGTGKQ